jgi:phosphoglycolate phosphatase-like HAD superfamily hydrolase
MASSHPVVFLFDVDNTLLDNDRVARDLREHLTRAFGARKQERYWAIFEELRAELGYADYLGALQRYRVEQPHDAHLLTLSLWLVDYPFANRLYPQSLDVLDRVREWGPAAILSDGDVVFQPRKIERSGLWDAVQGNVLIYIHKEHELEEVARHYPAVKAVWGDRVTTVFPRQGHYALDGAEVAKYPTPDITVERIGDLLTYDLSAFVPSVSPRP